MPIELIELMVNLKNWNFEIESAYKIDENEARKIINSVEITTDKIQQLICKG